MGYKVYRERSTGRTVRQQTHRVLPGEIDERRKVILEIAREVLGTDLGEWAEPSECFFCKDDRCSLREFRMSKERSKKRGSRQVVLACEECIHEIITGDYSREPVRFCGSGHDAANYATMQYNGTGSFHMLNRERDGDAFGPYMRT